MTTRREHGDLSARLDDALQDCLDSIEAGADPERVLARYPELRPELDDLLGAASALYGFAPEPLPCS